jgi:D-amino-acid oxidase
LPEAKFGYRYPRFDYPYRYPKTRPETTADLLKRGLELCPELVPPEVRASKESVDVEDLHPIIIEEACGLRPMRKGGPRITLAPPVTSPKGKKITVVYNYG